MAGMGLMGPGRQRVRAQVEVPAKLLLCWIIRGQVCEMLSVNVGGAAGWRGAGAGQAEPPLSR